MHKLSKWTKKHLAAVLIWSAIAFIVAAMLVVVLGIRSAQSESDGTNNYQGNNKRAAQLALDETNEFYSSGKESISNLVVLKRQAVSVEKIATPEKGVYSRCNSLYSVGIVEIYVFGRRSEPTNKVVCLGY